MILNTIYISPPVNQGRKHQNQPTKEEKKRGEQEQNTQTREKNTIIPAINPYKLKIQRLNSTTGRKSFKYSILRDLLSLFRSK